MPIYRRVEYMAVCDRCRALVDYGHVPAATQKYFEGVIRHKGWRKVGHEWLCPGCYRMHLLDELEKCGGTEI